MIDSNQMFTDCMYDVAIIGGGPAGIAAAISLKSEGARVVVMDQKAPGGQVATSSKIENVFGVPVGGISGGELMGRGIDKAHEFGTEFMSPFEAIRIERDPKTGIFTITGNNRERVTAASVVLSLGVSFRRLHADGLDQYQGRGVAYGAPSYQNREQWAGKKVALIGGGNSAGQGAHFLSTCKRCDVHIFVRGEGLEADMSYYLYKHVEEMPNITVHTHSELVQVFGNAVSVTGARFKVNGEEEKEVLPFDHLFIQIGAEPQTGWLGDFVEVDPKGYVVTDRDIPEGRWSLERQPYRFETSVPGVFTGGDVHSLSPNRMSCAIGEGHALAVSVYHYLGERLRQQAAPRTPRLVSPASASAGTAA